jgi:hypothetical protein
MYQLNGRDRSADDREKKVHQIGHQDMYRDSSFTILASMDTTRVYKWKCNQLHHCMCFLRYIDRRSDPHVSSFAYPFELQ